MMHEKKTIWKAAVENSCRVIDIGSTLSPWSTAPALFAPSSSLFSSAAAAAAAAIAVATAAAFSSAVGKLSGRSSLCLRMYASTRRAHSSASVYVPML